ncbi:MAG: cysteine-rich CWC family protein [Steroidobacteraceae bacterium]
MRSAAGIGATCDGGGVEVTRVDAPAEGTDTICFRCGAAFHCGAAAGEARCWCERQSRVAPVGEPSCLCPGCLGRAIEERRDTVIGQ